MTIGYVRTMIMPVQEALERVPKPLPTDRRLLSGSHQGSSSAHGINLPTQNDLAGEDLAANRSLTCINARGSAGCVFASSLGGDGRGGLRDVVVGGEAPAYVRPELVTLGSVVVDPTRYPYAELVERCQGWDELLGPSQVVLVRCVVLVEVVP
jgi:hypothetical protein